MRIGIVTSSYKPTANGVVSHIEELKSWFEKTGHEVFIFAPEVKNCQNKEKNVIRYPSLPNPKLKDYPVGLPFLIRKKEIEKLDLDIIHAHNPFLSGEFAARMAKKLQKPLILTHHTQWYLYSRHYFPRFKRVSPKIIDFLLKRFFRKCDAIVCPTKEISNQVEKIMPRAKTVVVPNGIDTNSFSPQKIEKKKQIIYIGRISKEKSIDQLLKVFKKINQELPNHKLVIVGIGELLQEMKKLTQDLGLSQNVLFLGQRDRETLPKLLNESLLFLTLSKTEVMPLTVIEAAACGLPIVAPDLPSFQEIFPDKKGAILLDSEDEMALAVINLLKHKKKLEELSFGAREAAEKLSSQNTAQNVIALYQDILNV